MKYTEEQLKFILERKPELIKKKEPNLDLAIIEFLKNHEVYVQAITTKTKPTRENIASGVLTGLAGPGVGLDTAQLSGQDKQTQIQEWTKWKQWALDQKEFPKFQTDYFNKVHEHNENIDKKLEDPEYQKIELDPLIQSNEKREKLISRLVLILLGLVLGSAIIGNTYMYFEDKNDNISVINKNIMKSL